jgi:hypothetical protein
MSRQRYFFLSARRIWFSDIQPRLQHSMSQVPLRSVLADGEHEDENTRGDAELLVEFGQLLHRGRKSPKPGVDQPRPRFSQSTNLVRRSRMFGQFRRYVRKCFRRKEILRLYGGGGSLERTALWLHFPANREFNSEISSFLPSFLNGLTRHAAQFTVLSPL